MTKSCSKARFVVLSPEPKLAATGQDGSGWPPDWPIARPSYSKLSYCTKKDQVMKMRCNLAVAQSCPINCVLSNLPSQKPSKQIAFVRKQTTNSGKRIWCQNTSLSSQDFPCCSSSSPTLQKLGSERLRNCCKCSLIRLSTWLYCLTLSLPLLLEAGDARGNAESKRWSWKASEKPSSMN